MSYINKWTIINNGYANYYYRPDHFDTNGIIQTYYFGLTNDTGAAIYKGPLDSASITIDNNNINKGSIRYVFGKDDDGFLRGNKSGNAFVVFADSAPPAPSVTFTQPGAGIVLLKWKNMDVKDDSATQYAIVLGTTANTLTDTLITFTPGKDAAFGKASGWFTKQFNPQIDKGYTTDFYFMVISKDARGTKSKSNGGLGTLISYP
ncbi:MAG: hypothetical protein PHC61_00300 [Chitinivibrionales bacterium]|nr:hypothetical protein [Chitinivibrionales bacterium]